MSQISSSQDRLVQKLHTLVPHWEDANVFLRFLDSGIMHEEEIDELLLYIDTAESDTADALYIQTKSILQSLRAKEEQDRQKEQKEQVISLLF